MSNHDQISIGAISLFPGIFFKQIIYVCVCEKKVQLCIHIEMTLWCQSKKFTPSSYQNDENDPSISELLKLQ